MAPDESFKNVDHILGALIAITIPAVGTLDPEIIG
jgi:hypothetical protein